MELEAAHFEKQFSFLEALFGVFEGKPEALVPDDHFARAVIALWNHALEVGVLHGVVLHHHREPLFRDVRGGSVRDGPTHECAAPLEPEIVVKPRRRVFLDYEQAWLGPVGLVGKPKTAKGLRRLRSRAFGAIRLEGCFLMRRHPLLLSTGPDFDNSTDLERIAGHPSV